MFKKTITELKDLKETKHEVNVNVVIDPDPMIKSFIKTYLVVVGIRIAMNVVVQLIDQQSKSSAK